MHRVDALRVGYLNPFHAFHTVGLRRLKKKRIVIVHKALGEEQPPFIIGTEDLLIIMSTTRRVVVDSRIFMSDCSDQARLSYRPQEQEILQ